MKTIVLSGLILLLLIAGENCSDSQKPISNNVIDEGLSVNGLQLSIKSDKMVYKLNPKERIIIDFIIRNVGKKDIYICKNADGVKFLGTYSSYEISGPEGAVKEEKECIGLKMPPSSPSTKDSFVLLKRGEFQVKKLFAQFEEYTFILDAKKDVYSSTRWFLTKPGTYQIKIKSRSEVDGKEAGLNAWTGEVISNTITVEIKE
jgi:hypothetical protein